MATFGALVCGLWPATAEAIVCESEQGTCEVTVDGNMEDGSCRCADCSPAIGWGGGGEEPLPEPTEESCLETLGLMCEGEPVTDAADVCSPQALELCEGGLVEFYMRCGAPTNRDEELCITVACCERAEEDGIEATTELLACVGEHEDCEAAYEACSTADDGDGAGGDGGSDGGEGADGDGDADGDDGDDKSGCGCATAPAPATVPLLALPILALLRRRVR